MIPEPELNIWAQTRQSLYLLYARRAQGLEPELDCHAQAAEIYAPHFQPSDRILDAGGGSGYFYWSLARRGLLGQYHLLDQTEAFLKIAREALGEHLPPERFIFSSIQESPGNYEVTFCLNCLFCLPDYRQGLERLLLATRRLFILRSTLAEKNIIRYETDAYLDPPGRHLKAYFNIWSLEEVAAFIRQYGFETSTVVDRRSGDQPEISAGKIFPWRWLIGRRL